MLFLLINNQSQKMKYFRRFLVDSFIHHRECLIKNMFGQERTELFIFRKIAAQFGLSRCISDNNILQSRFLCCKDTACFLIWRRFIS
jgi:hypothetical protein